MANYEVTQYINHPGDWNDHWQLQSDLGPGLWLKALFEESAFDRPESGPGIAVSLIMGRGWDAYLCLPHEAMHGEVGADGWGYEYLSDRVSVALATVLRRHCSDADTCWAASWEGFGDSPTLVRASPHKLEIRSPGGGHGHVLSRGSLSYIEDGGGPSGIWPDNRRSPNYWWPSTKEWLVGSEIDTAATYIGCSEDCSTELLALGIEGLEAVQASDRAMPDF